MKFLEMFGISMNSHKTISICMPIELVKRFDELKKNSGCKNDVEVVQKALTYYETLINESMVGGRIILEDVEGNQRELQFR
jgi:metal-responsive CopG/Arc/MetJ family transcriptional regulator